MLRFIIDTQLPPKLCRLFNEVGYNSIHTTDFPDGHLLNDKAIREIAIKEQRIIVTKDSDFYDYYHLKGSPPSVLLLSMGNISNNNLFIQLQNHLAGIEKIFMNGSTLIIFDGLNLVGF